MFTTRLENTNPPEQKGRVSGHVSNGILLLENPQRSLLIYNYYLCKPFILHSITEMPWPVLIFERYHLIPQQFYTTTFHASLPVWLISTLYLFAMCFFLSH